MCLQQGVISLKFVEISVFFFLLYRTNQLAGHQTQRIYAMMIKPRQTIAFQLMVKVVISKLSFYSLSMARC
jgi:hypothetical protein